MHSSKGWSGETREPSEDLAQVRSPSSPGNSLGEKMPPLFRVSLPERIARWSRTPQGLAGVCICWLLLLLVLLFGFTLAISWGTLARASNVSSMAALLWENDLAGSTGRRPFSCLSPQCEDWSNTLEEGRSSLRFETNPEREMLSC